MRNSPSVGWLGLGLSIAAIAIMVLQFLYPGLERYEIVSVEAGAFIAGAMAALAAIIGFVAFKTPQGKVAAIGGIALVVRLGGPFKWMECATSAAVAEKHPERNMLIGGDIESESVGGNYPARVTPWIGRQSSCGSGEAAL